MAYKDEYEVARLYTDGSFRAAARASSSRARTCAQFHLAPPLLAQGRSRDRRAAQDELRPLDDAAFRVLAKLKGLRGTAFDIFGYTAERRTERS
jgi:indolepyruvate ferredoxin oxidoreductase